MSGKGRVAGSKNKVRRLSDVQIERMVKKYREGASTTLIAQALSFNATTITRYLREAGIEIRPAGFRFGEDHHQWRGGRIVGSTGYIFRHITPEHTFFCMAVKKAGNHSYVLEHRLVMAESLGRPLEDHETVHHIDGNKENNDPGNLQLRSGRHGRGAAFRCADCGSCNITSVAL